MKNKRLAIVNLNLEFEIPNNKDVEEFLMEVKLPKNYVVDSMELVKVMHFCEYCESHYDAYDGHTCMQMKNKNLA